MEVLTVEGTTTASEGAIPRHPWPLRGLAACRKTIDSGSPLSRAIGAQRPYFTCGNFVSLSVFRKATMSSSSESVSFRFPMSFYPGSGRPSRARARLRCNNSHGTTRLPHQTTRRRHVSGTKGTFWAHLWRTEHSLPLVASGEYAGRPACFADGPTDHPGAPKGIRNLTWGFRVGSEDVAEYLIVAGQGRCPVSGRPVRSRRVACRFSAFSAHKAREWHAPT
jgi:hypothetical protein